MVSPTGNLIESDSEFERIYNNYNNYILIMIKEYLISDYFIIRSFITTLIILFEHYNHVKDYPIWSSIISGNITINCIIISSAILKNLIDDYYSKI